MESIPYENSKNRRPITERGGVMGKECVYCGHWKPLEGGFTKGPYDGKDHRCRDCKKAKRIEAASTQVVDDTPRQVGYAMLRYEGAEIAFEMDRSQVSLTDLWIAAGRPENQRPVDWLSLQKTKDLLGELKVGEQHLYSARLGAHGGTWAPREIALAYAMYLNPALHAAVLRFVLGRSDEFAQGGAPPQALALMQQLLTPIYERLGILGLLPSIAADAHQAAAGVRGARRIEIEIPAPVINGDVYFGTLNSKLMIPALQCGGGEAGDWELVPNLIHLLQTDWVCFIFGESTEMERRMKKHAGKNRIGKTTPIRPSITSDSPKDLENLFRERKPFGVIVVPNTKDLLVVRRSVLPSLIALPSHMPIKDAKEHLRIGWMWEV